MDHLSSKSNPKPAVLIISDRWGSPFQGGIPAAIRLLAQLFHFLGFAIYCTVLQKTKKEEENAKELNVTLVSPKLRGSLELFEEKPCRNWLISHASYFINLKDQKILGNIKIVLGFALATSEASSIIRDDVFTSAKYYITNLWPCDKVPPSILGCSKEVLNQLVEMLEGTHHKAADTVTSIDHDTFKYFINRLTNKHIQILPTPEEKYFSLNPPTPSGITKYQILSCLEECDMSAHVDLMKEINSVAENYHAARQQQLKWVILGVCPTKEDELIATLKPFRHLHIVPKALQSSSQSIEKDLCETNLVLIPPKSPGVNSLHLLLSTMATGIPLLAAMYSPCHDFIKTYFPYYEGDIIVDMETPEALAKKIPDIFNNYQRFHNKAADIKARFKREVVALIDKINHNFIDHVKRDPKFGQLLSSVGSGNQGRSSADTQDTETADNREVMEHEPNGNAGTSGDNTANVPDENQIQNVQNIGQENGDQNASNDASGSTNCGTAENNENKVTSRSTGQISIHVDQSGIPKEDLTMADVSQKYEKLTEVTEKTPWQINGIYPGITVEDIGEGSIIYHVKCETLDALNYLWHYYKSQKLHKLITSTTVTKKTLAIIGAVYLELQITMDIEEYRQCKLELTPKGVHKLLLLGMDRSLKPSVGDLSWLLNAEQYIRQRGRQFDMLHAVMTVTDRVQHILSSRQQILALLGVTRYLFSDAASQDLTLITTEALEEQLIQDGTEVPLLTGTDENCSSLVQSLLSPKTTITKVTHYWVEHLLKLGNSVILSKLYEEKMILLKQPHVSDGKQEKAGSEEILKDPGKQMEGDFKKVKKIYSEHTTEQAVVPQSELDTVKKILLHEQRQTRQRTMSLEEHVGKKDSELEENQKMTMKLTEKSGELIMAEKEIAFFKDQVRKQALELKKQEKMIQKLSGKSAAVQVYPCKLQVTGFNRGLSRETLELYFESKRSGGGPVEESEMKDDGTFVITFESPEVAERVLNRPDHKVRGSTLTVKQFVPSVQCIDTKDEEGTVQVRPSGALQQSPSGSGGDFQKQEPDPNMQYPYGQQQYLPGWNPYQPYQGMYQPQPQPQMPPGYPSYPHLYQQYSGWYYPQQSHQQDPFNWAPPPNKQPGQSRKQDDSSHQLSLEVIQKYIQSLPPDQQEYFKRCPLEYVSAYFHSLPPDRKEFFLRKEQPENQNSQEKDGDEDSMNIDDCTLAVTGFEPGTSADVLEMYFENKKKSGGGQVKKLELKDGTIFLVTFESVEVAEHVINHGTHVLNNKPLTVQWFKPEKEEREEITVAAITSDSAHSGFGDAVQLDPCKLQVTGFKTGTSQETLELHFESKRKSGGGTFVESYMLDDRTFVIKFESREVAECVLSRENHNLEGSTLTVQQFVPSVKQPDEKDMQGAVHVDPCKLLVTGFKRGSSIETLELYFESKRKSGGGPVLQSEMIDDGTFVITFESSEVAERVLSRENHNWEGSTLTVQQFVPSVKQPDEKDMEVSSAVQVDPCKLQVTGFKEGTPQETLELYFESERKSAGGPVVESEMRDDGTFVIKFESSEVAERVLSQESHTFLGSTLTVEQCVPSVKQHDKKEKQGALQVDPCKLLVTGFKKGTSEETLELYFESQKKSGGGPLEDSEMIDDGTFVIKFESSEVAERVLSQESHNWEGSTLTVKQFVPSVKQPDKTDKQGTVQVHPCKLLVTGFKRGTSLESLELYFESKRKSGGGPVLQSEMIDDGTFVITFKSSEVTEQVLNRQEHKLGGSTLTVKQYVPSVQCIDTKDEEESDQEEEANCTIEVRGFTEETGTDTLELYFESKRSGGGPIESSQIINDVMIITFESPDVVARVLKKNHKVSGVKLTVKEPAKKKKKPKLPRDTKSFLLRGLAEVTSRENLELYLENCTGMDDEEPELFFGEEPDVVLVRYPVEIKDYENIVKRITKKKLNKAKISMEPVYLTNCILVTNVPSNCTEDTIELYFESTKKSGGGEVVEVEVNTEENTALVSFKDYKVLESVLYRQHTLSKQSIQVQPYYECLGEVVSRDEPPARIPDQMTLKGPQFSVLKYIMSKPELLTELKQALSKVYAQHEWPAEGKDNAILLIPNFPKNVENQFQKCKAWPQEVETALTTFLKNFKCIDIPVLEGIWLQVISQKDGWARGDVDVVEDQDSSQLFISGRTNSVEQVEDRVKRVIKDIEEQMQKAKQMIKDNAKLNGPKVKQLMMCSFAKMAMQKFPDLNVKVTPKHNQVTFEGLPNDVTAAKCEMYETLNNMPKRRFKPPTPSQLHFLQQASASQKIYDMFKEKKVQAVYFVENDEVVLSAMKENVLKQACEILRSSITEEKMSLKPRSLPAIQKQEWNSLVQKLEDEHTLTIVIPRHNQHAVLVTGFETSVRSVLPQLQDYIALNTEVDESVKIESGRMQYIQTYAKDEISNIQQGAKRLPLRINMQSKGHFTIFTISGTEEDVKIAAKELQQLADSVFRRPYPVDKPGMAKLFTGDKGKSYLKMTEAKFKCIIDVNNPSEEDSTMPDSTHEEDFEEISMPIAQPTTYHILCYHTLKDRRRIVVGKGDLTKMHVDVIVNAANTRLDFSTGRLAKAVADAGGPEMQTDCAQIIRSRGRLFEGQAVSTGAGNLPCKSVVHAVAPEWHGSGHRWRSRQDEARKEELMLTDAVRNSLEVAEKMGHTSIAIPAIGAGGNGFPLDLCVQTILGAVDLYCRRNKPKSLMEIRIVDNADATCKKFQDALVEQYGSSNVVITSDEKSDDWQVAPSHSDEEEENEEGFSTGAGVQSKNNPYVFKTAEDKYITMIKDSIAKQQVDVIVNTAQTSLDLNTGAVSKAILQVGGPQLQQEVDIQKTEVSTNEGDIVVTSATGKLKCKKVFHVLCCQWDSGGKAEKLLKSVMQQCFDIADKSGMKSIAFPAIGTGGLKFPRDVTAKIMYEEAKNFSASKPKSQLTDIKFVIYDQDHETIMAFEDVITSLTGVPLRKRHQRRSPAKHDGAKKMSKKKKVHSYSPMQSTQYSLNTTAVQHHSTAGTDTSGQNLFTNIKKSKYQWDIMIGNICVQVQRGDITTETTEAIVNSTNENLDLRMGAVSKAILQAGGRSIVDECQTLGRQLPGAVVITEAGKLRCNYIIHVVTVTQQTLEQSIMGILQLAEQNGIKSLSMPAIGTGGLGIDSSDVARKTFHVIGDFAQQVYQQNLRLIRITIFQQPIVGIFQQAMTDLLEIPRTQDDRGPMRKWFGAVGSTIRQAFMGPDKEEQTVLRKQFNTIVLDVYAGSQQNINGAIKHLEVTMDQEFSDVVVDDASVRKLSNEDMSSLNTLADSLNVKVYMVDTGSVSRLHIQGGPMDVMTVHKQVNVLLERIHDEERQESEAKLLAKNVRWLFLNEKEEFEEYDLLTSGIIERAFQHNKSDITLNIEEGQYKIDFKKMMESDLDNPSSSVVEVRRELKEGGFGLPSSWTTMASGKQVERVVLDPKSNEYDTVVKHFKQTMQNRPLQAIHQIERIQNPKLYRQYMVLKQNMDAKNKSGIQNEKLLYHGTGGDSVAKINAGGFNRSFAGKNATVYGVGSYFAVNASYSAHDTYSPPDGSSKKYIYQAKVLTGEFTTGARGMLIPPSKNSNDPTDCYDSVVDNLQNPALFVVFNDAMAYPEYLIVFQ